MEMNDCSMYEIYETLTGNENVTIYCPLEHTLKVFATFNHSIGNGQCGLRKQICVSAHVALRMSLHYPSQSIARSG